MRQSVGLLLSSVLLTHPVAADPAGPVDVSGLWAVLDDGKPSGAVMRLTIVEGRLVGFIEKTAPSIQPDARCDACPEPLKGRPLVGLEIMSIPRPEGNGSWSGGKIVDPRSGDIYRCRLTVESTNTIVVRGYIGIPLFGASQTWRRLP